MNSKQWWLLNILGLMKFGILCIKGRRRFVRDCAIGRQSIACRGGQNHFGGGEADQRWFLTAKRILILRSILSLPQNCWNAQKHVGKLKKHVKNRSFKGLASTIWQDMRWKRRRSQTTKSLGIRSEITWGISSTNCHPWNLR